MTEPMRCRFDGTDALSAVSYPGRARVSYEILPGPLAPIRTQAPTLDTIAEAALEADPTPPDDRRFDVFVSHASEDKDAIVHPLAHALEGHGLEVWYDESVLRVVRQLASKDRPRSSEQPVRRGDYLAALPGQELGAVRDGRARHP